MKSYNDYLPWQQRWIDLHVVWWRLMGNRDCEIHCGAESIHIQKSIETCTCPIAVAYRKAVDESRAE